MMKKIKTGTCLPTTTFILLLGIALLMSSCIRQGPYECDDTRAQVKVEFDYNYAGIPRSGTTVIFYPATSSPSGERTTVSTHSSSATASLLPGIYSVLVINETFGDFSNIRFRNTESYNKVEAYTIPVADTDQITRSPMLHHSPDILVVDTLSSFTVTPAMVQETNQRMQATANLPTSQVFTLRRAIATVNVALHIKNMKYLRTVASSISGFSQAQILTSGRNNTTAVAHGIENMKAVYTDETKNNGIITGTFNTFGLNPTDEKIYRLIFDALLIDGETKIHEEFDISDIIETVEGDYGIYIDIEFGTKENPSIEIPQVKPEEGTSPFDPEVDDWEEDGAVEVPV